MTSSFKAANGAPKKDDAMTRLLLEHRWLTRNPQFDERPASIEQFLGLDYLNLESKIRPGLRKALVEIFGTQSGGKRMSKYEKAMVTGAIGIGKTTFASIALPYMAHWVLCLKDPQDYFNLMPGSRIAFMQMSTSEKQVLEVVFGDILARIDNSKWFEKYPRDRKLTRAVKFPKDIWIIPGDSSETSFEGYNILAGILDEMDSHKVTKEKDYAEDGYNTIESRIASRYVDPDTGGHKGLLICIGQMKKSDGFAARKFKEMQVDPKAHVTRMSIWESLGWQLYTKKGVRDSFWYHPGRKEIIPKAIVDALDTTDHLIEIPNAYLDQFVANPPKALRDLAGIPPTVEDAFIALEDRVLSCEERWREHNPGLGSPVNESTSHPKFESWFRANGNPLRRVVSIDMALSGDALGLAMGHVSEIIEMRSGEKKPYIVMDFLMRVKAVPGSQIILSDIRDIIYYLKDELGFRIVEVTADGFNSTDTMQQLRKRRIQAQYLSTDKSKLPYEDLRDAIYEQRIEWPPYRVYENHGDLSTVAIATKELLHLQDTGRKIDHPAKGSKDVSDAMAGVVTTLMGDRTYRRGVASTPEAYRGEYDTPLAPDETDAYSPAVPSRFAPSGKPDVDALNHAPDIGGLRGSADVSTIFQPFVPSRVRQARRGGF